MTRSSRPADDGTPAVAPPDAGRPRRLLWVTNLPAPYRLAVWDEMVRSGIDLEVWVLSENSTNRTWGQGVDRPYVRLLPARKVRLREGETYLSRVSLPRLVARMRERDAVVIGGWELLFYWRVALVAAALRIPRVLFYESTGASHHFSTGPVAWIRRAFLKHSADAVLVPGVAAERAVLAHGIPRSRIVTTFNSIDQCAVRRAVEEAAAERTPYPLRFCYVGQLIERKNVAALLEAFWAVDIPAAQLHVIGQGPLRTSLEELSRRLADRESGKEVVWHGGLAPDLAIRRMAAAHVLVLPSTVEVWGLVVNEALAAGLRVVVSTPCGVTPSVAGMEGVYLCEPTPLSIRGAMEAAAADWDDWIADPEILHTGTPRRFADDSMRAVHLAAGRQVHRS
ncbi:glycosyltransferase family 4 protein [Geodermatophilus sp. SYSU D00758]